MEFLENILTLQNLLLSIILILIIILIKIKIKQVYKSFLIRRRLSRGNKLEEKAAKYLKKRGYAVIHKQHPGKSIYYVDDLKHSADVYADYIVEKSGKEFVVEVKSGKEAVSPSYTATRRQLLEYNHAFKTDGILLLNMEKKELFEIRFH